MFSFQNDKITELKNLVTAGTSAANAKMNKSGILKVRIRFYTEC